jgi:hypothetical protein
MFAYKLFEILYLLMPTMSINKGDKEDSDYEEEVLIAQREIKSLAYARKLIIDNSLPLFSSPKLVTIQLLSLNDEEFFGIRVTSWNP